MHFQTNRNLFVWNKNGILYMELHSYQKNILYFNYEYCFCGLKYVELMIMNSGFEHCSNIDRMMLETDMILCAPETRRNVLVNELPANRIFRRDDMHLMNCKNIGNWTNREFIGHNTMTGVKWTLDEFRVWIILLTFDQMGHETRF